MKIKPEQLEQTMQKSLQPLYIISGDDVLLCQEAADTVRKQVAQLGVDERLRFVADSQFDWQEVTNEMQTLSLFSGQRLLDIQIDKMTEKHSKALGVLSDLLSTDNITLLTLPKLDSRTQKTKWFSKLEAQGVFAQVWPIDANRLPNWLQQRANRLNIHLTQEAALLLCERNEGNLLALSQELEKIVLRKGEDLEVDIQTIADTVSDSSRYSVYDLSDRILMGKVKEALHCLQQLVAEGVDYNIILWLLNKEVSTLDTLYIGSQSSSLRQVCRQQRIWDKQIPLYESAMSRHNSVTIQYMQRYLALLDQAVKGLHTVDIEIGFRNLVMMLCGFKPVVTELDGIAPNELPA